MIRRFTLATAIDALGSGLWMPFALLFLVHAKGMALVDAGSALSVGTLIGLATGPFVGSLTDWVGPKAVLVASNLVRLVAFVAYPLVASGWQVLVVAAVVAVGDRLFWTANAPMIEVLTVGRDAENVLASQSAARFTGAGLGAAMVAVLPEVGGPGAYQLVCYANAGTFAAAAILLLGLPGLRSAAAPEQRRGSWLVVLRDRPYLGYCAAHTVFALASVSKFAILPVLVLDVLHGPGWIPGTAIGIGTAVIVFGQRRITRFLARYGRGTALLAAALVFGCSFALLAAVTVVPLAVAAAIVLGTAFSMSVAEAMFGPAAMAAAAAAAPAGAQGRASAVYQLSWGFAHVTGPILLTGLLSIGNPVLWLTLAAACLAVLPALSLLRRALPPAVLTA